MTNHIKYVLFSLVLVLSSISVPAADLPTLPVDSRIIKGTLGCGATYYMVSNTSVKGYADIAVIRRDEAPSQEARRSLRSDFFSRMGDENLWLATTKAPRSYAEADFRTENVKLMFGKETAGLPEWLRERYRDRCVRIPMIGPVRSLNLANSVAILCYEALRQQGFPDLTKTGSMYEAHE